MKQFIKRQSSVPSNMIAPPRWMVQSERNNGSLFSMNVRTVCRNTNPSKVTKPTGFSRDPRTSIKVASLTPSTVALAKSRPAGG